MQQGMIWVGRPEQSDGQAINRVGSNSGLMAQVGPNLPATDIPQGDLVTAHRCGARVASIAARLKT